MRIGQIIGNVTLSRSHPSVAGASWRVVVPLTAAGAGGDASGRGEPFVLFDELGAGVGSLVAISEGAEAAAPFHPDQKPLDAYNAALLDTIEITTD
jgi:ethanolamine utilization protein EutN